MKEHIKNAILSKSMLTNDQVIEVFTSIGAEGDIILLKNDGLRTENKFTVVITSSNGQFESIRYDDQSLNGALAKCLLKYFEIKKL